MKQKLSLIGTIAATLGLSACASLPWKNRSNCPKQIEDIVLGQPGFVRFNASTEVYNLGSFECRVGGYEVLATVSIHPLTTMQYAEMLRTHHGYRLRAEDSVHGISIYGRRQQ